MSNSRWRLGYVCVALVIFVLALDGVSTATAATARDRAVNLAGQQRMLAVRMASEAVLIALEIDKEVNLGRLSETRKLFARTLNGLRNGDSELGLPAASETEVLERLTQVESVWQHFDRTIRQALKAGTVTEQEVRTIARINPQLLDALDQAVGAYVRFVFHGETFTLHTRLLNTAGEQRMRAQQVLRDFLLVAYGHDTVQHQELLSQSFALYGRNLKGLIHGDAELGLVPAPRPEIGAQLQKVERLWSELRPLVESAARGSASAPDTIKQAARLTAHMVRTMNNAVLMYENL